MIKVKPLTCKKCKSKNVFKVVEFDEVLKLFILEWPKCGLRVMMSEKQFEGYYGVSDKIASKLRKLLRELKDMIQRGS